MRPTQTEKGIALLRIVFGFWLLRDSIRVLNWVPWPWPGPVRVQIVTGNWAELSLNHPWPVVRYLLEQAMVPQGEVFLAILLIWGLIAGISLTFGMLTVLGGLMSMVLALFQLVLVHHTGNIPLGYFLFQAIAAMVFAGTRAGRRWGIDALFTTPKTRSWFY